MKDAENMGLIFRRLKTYPKITSRTVGIGTV